MARKRPGKLQSLRCGLISWCSAAFDFAGDMVRCIGKSFYNLSYGFYEVAEKLNDYRKSL